MEEDIKILEKKLKIIESLCTDDCINKSTVIQPLKYAIENLIKGYRKLEEITKSFIWQSNFDMKFYEENSIPKSKIKEFVEENKWDLSETEYHFESTVVDVDELLKFMEDK